MKRATLEWAAGFFDGRGSATASHGQPRLAIRCFDGELLHVFESVVGCGKVYGPYENPDRRQPSFMWVAVGNDAAELAARLLPSMHSRRVEQIRRVFHS